MIAGGGVSASLEFAIMIESKIGIVSYFDRSINGVRCISASLEKTRMRVRGFNTCKPDWAFESYIQPLISGKEKFYHCLSFSNEFGKKLFLTTDEWQEHDFYNYLMCNFNYPILKEWSMQIFAQAVKDKYVRNLRMHVVKGTCCDFSDVIQINRKNVDLRKISVYLVEMNEDQLKKILSKLLREKTICISKTDQKPLNFKDMDEYFSVYGKSLVSNLEQQLKPLVPLEGRCKCLAFNTIRLMPPQAAQVNGLVEALKKGRYAILNMGMGTGKTITSIAAVEGYFNIKNGSRLKEIYSNPEAIKYRNVIMCPGHMVEKWAKEIRQQVPFAKVSILNSFSQLVELKKQGRERTKREWYVIGKDFAKLGYQMIPVPKKAGNRAVYARACADCGKRTRDFRGNRFHCKVCNGINYKPYLLSEERVNGLICPFCGHLLMENRNYENADESQEIGALTGLSFTAQNSRNMRCHLCGEYLWQPHVANLSLSGFQKKDTPWYQATHYSNKTHKGKKTVWIHEEYAKSYFKSIGEEPLNEKRSEGIRRYPPASYIKKQLKGFFDFLILDEAHLYKGGGTAQGNAMHAFVKSSRKVLALTGTIAGGMANDLFYLLYRLDPRRMVSHGYKFSDELNFTEKYGSIETLYEVNVEDQEYNKISRGRQIQNPRPKPGISPIIFNDFLLDKGVFLDLSDMSEMLPPYREIVVTVEVPNVVRDESGERVNNLEYEEQDHYKMILRSLREKSKKMGRGILGAMLQFALSYPDKPYGVSNMVNPYDGSLLEIIPDFRELIENDGMLEKEKRLVEVARKELAEGRNCVIYVEFTGTLGTCITHRLKEILIKNTMLSDEEVVILEASSPPAREREAWMHKKAENGAKVFITNPKCVETGLDFIWEKDGVIYNFPTLIFYQLGYSLFTVWQASRRAYRLVQKEECRTYYFAYAGTLQEMAVQIIAEKQTATAAIQGKFSAGGIAAMANGVDARVRLAQALCGMDMKRKDLQSMFDAASKSGVTSKFHDVSKMPLISEIVGSDGGLLHGQEQEAADLIENEDYFSLLHRLDEAFLVFQEDKMEDDESEKEDADIPEVFSQWTELLCGNMNLQQKKSVKRKMKKEVSQVTLFDFC